jgi:myb proto-oncogene protein
VCCGRWPNIDQAIRRKGGWTEDENLKLKHSVQLHGGKDWVAIAELVPGRTKNQCRQRWHNILDPSIALKAGSTGTWAEDEDLKLKNSVQIHGDKDWVAIAEMVPGRTTSQ